MKWKKFDIVYANGSSLSAGGGLEWGLSRKLYKEKYGLENTEEAYGMLIILFRLKMVVVYVD
jgi:hypothetical protein